MAKDDEVCKTAIDSQAVEQITDDPEDPSVFILAVGEEDLPEPYVDSDCIESNSIQLAQFDLESYQNPFNTIQQLRKYNETVDLVLATPDGGFEPVHSYYIAVKAPKFWNQICAHQDERTVVELRTSENVRVMVPKVVIPNIDQQMLKIVIDTMYAGKVTLNYTLTWQLLHLASKFNLDFLINTCLNYLSHKLALKNCVMLFKVGLRYKHQLAYTAYHYIQANFVKVIKLCQHFGLLSLNQLTAFLNDNRLNVYSEIYVWRAIVIWIRFDIRTRLEHFWKLFPYVRFNLIPRKLIRKEIVPDFCTLDLCSERILTKMIEAKNPCIDLNIFNPREPHQMVMIYGGYEHGIPSSTIKTFDIRAGMWFKMQLSDKYPRVYHATVVFGHKVYIIGGSDGIQIFNSVIRFDPIHYKFETCKSMNELRCYHCAVRYGNYLVVMGGNNGKERLRTCEMYDPHRNTWRYIEPMNSARCDASATVFNGKIYIAGGIEAFGISSVEVYSFVSRSWTVVSFMNLPRRSFHLVTYMGNMYAIGGCTDTNDYTCLKSVERFNQSTSTWSLVAPLKHKRTSFCVAVLDDKLFVYGGYNGFSSFRSIECFHHYTLEWEKVGHQLPDQLSGASAVILNELPNTIDYTYYGQCLMSGSNVRSSAAGTVHSLLRKLQKKSSKLDIKKRKENII